MSKIRDFLTGLWKDESAEITVEYGLLTALVALGLIAVFILFKDNVGIFFNNISNRIKNCPSAGTC